MASLGSLPSDVFVQIAGLMDDGRGDGSLAALAAACRGFYNLAVPFLYRHVAERHPALLHWAALFGRVDTAKRAIDAGAPVDMPMVWDDSTSRDFETTCGRRAPHDIYQRLQTDLGGSSFAITGEFYPTLPRWLPIHLAAMSGSVELVELLVETSPATMGAWCYRLCQYLPQNLPGPARSRSDSHCYLPLHVAARHGHWHVVRRLLELGCEPVSTVRFQGGPSLTDPEPASTALHDAARFGQVDMIRFILDGGYQTDVQELDDRQLSPLWYAYAQNQWEAVDVLLAYGADIDGDAGYGYTPLIDACFCLNPEGLDELIARGANVHVQFYAPPGDVVLDAAQLAARGVRPIDICCAARSDRPLLGRLDVLRDEASQTWKRGHSTEWTAYYNKERYRRPVLVSSLIQAGALDRVSEGQPPPLVMAAASHLSDVVSALLEQGAPVNLADRDGVSPLAAVFAYSNSYCPLHPQINNDADETQPFLATGKGPRDWIHYDKYLEPDRGGCPGLRTCVHLLLQHGADANQADVNGNTPLCRLFAAQCFRPNLGLRSEVGLWLTPLDRRLLAPLLLQHGGNPNDRMTPLDPAGTGYRQVPAADWTARHWPLTLLEHAFWDADLEGCRLLLEAGAEPSQDTVFWMTRLVLAESQGRDSPKTEPALEFISNLPPETRCAGMRHPLCLALALDQGWLDIAWEIWALGLELCQFSEKAPARAWSTPAPAPSDEQVELGVLCLHAAASRDATSILEGLLELGVRPIPPSALLSTIHLENDYMLRCLVKHGGMVHIRDNETDGNGLVRRHPEWQHRSGCIDPLRYAIAKTNDDAITTMLRGSQHPINPWFRYYYLKEAYTRLEPSTLARLLEHPRMRRFDEADVTDEADMPLARLVRDVEPLCGLLYTKRRPADYGPRHRAENARRWWVGCVAAFAHAGVDPAVRDREGRSALDYLGEHLTYAGKNQFRMFLRDELRAVVGAQVGEEVDPAAVYEAIGATYRAAFDEALSGLGAGL